MRSPRVILIVAALIAGVLPFAGRGVSARQSTVYSVVERLSEAGPARADEIATGVVVQFNRLAQAAGERAQVRIALPQGLDIAARLNRFDQFDGGAFVASGPLVGGHAGEVSLSVAGDTLVGRIVMDGQLVRIRPAGGAHVVEFVDQSSFPLEGQPLVPTPVPGEAGDAATGWTPQAVAADTGQIVDLLVAYTPAARNAAGGDSAIAAIINQAVSAANTAYASSGLTRQLRLVQTMGVSYTEDGDSGVDLTRLTSAADGYMDEIHAARDAAGADFVTLLNAATDLCGIAWVMGPSDNNMSFARSAFSVVNWSCAATNLSLAHEIGHNMGLNHDRENATGTPVTDYAYGYRIAGLARDVMAYPCEMQGLPACPRLTIFSTPLFDFPGTASAAGTPTEDGARALGLTAVTVANFRDRTCTYAANAHLVTMSLSGGTGSITLVASRADCAWTVTAFPDPEDPAVISVTGSRTRLGSGTVDFTVPPATGSPRTFTMYLGPETVTIEQGTAAASCAPAVAYTGPALFPSGGGTGSFTLTFSAVCSNAAWSAASASPWLVVGTPASGVGNAVVPFLVQANVQGADRGTTFTISGPGFTTVERAVSQIAPTFSVTPATTALVAVKLGAGSPLMAHSEDQAVAVTLDSVGGGTWTATSDQPWLVLRHASGAGTGTFYMRVANPNDVLGTLTTASATVTVTASDFGTQKFVVTLNLLGSSSLGALPFGVVDTPLDLTTVSGAVPVTGWVLGQSAVSGVAIWRDAVDGVDAPASIQSNGWVFIGQAAFVPGARPDVAAAFPTAANSANAGWGYLLLTNMLPHQINGTASGGQGPFTFHATATMGATLIEIGSKTVTADNDHATRPFGAIDTPTQGGAVSGLYANFGWALARGSALIPTDGSTMVVFIDGVSTGRPTYNQCRGSNVAAGGSPFLPANGTCDDDVATLFRATSLNVAPGTGRGAIGSYVLDTTGLTAGLHSIAWSVTDNQGHVDGIGSRYFIVAGPDAAIGDVAADAAAVAQTTPTGWTGTLGSFVNEDRDVLGRVGFAPDAAFERISPDASGTRHARLREMDRIEIDLGGPVSGGALVIDQRLFPLPTGSHLDADGRFTWIPAPGFLGAFELRFSSLAGVIPVRIEVVPRVLGPEHEGLRMWIDTPTVQQDVSGAFAVAGWALDPQAWTGAGIDAVHVWAVPVDSTAAARFLGAATLGAARPDVAAAFGPQYDRSGYGLIAPALTPGMYDVIVYAHSTRTGQWEDARVVRVQSSVGRH